MPTRRWLSGWFVSAALVAAVTGVLLLLEGHTRVSGLVVLYLLAVVPVAVVWGVMHALVASVASAAVFDYVFVPPRYGFEPIDTGDWIGLAAFVVAALVTSRLATLSRERARDLERILDLSLDMLSVSGDDGYLKRVNPAFERTLGYSRRELLSRPLLEFVHPDDRERARGEMSGALARGEGILRFEDRFVSRDGSVRWLEWNARQVPEQGLTYAAARDVTERRFSEDRLREAQRMVEASRDELRVLADEQAALRRVATLVARGVPPAEIFSAVADEVGALFGAEEA
ncbi:MAG: domain S-box, partial [Solirubrobacterales bacterium]|nr:domain S-box [Solirubrobacterales bacterium]